MMIIDGKKIANDILTELRAVPRPNKLLAAVLVGDNAQSKSFLRQKEKMAQMLDVPFHLYQFDDTISEEDLIREIRSIGSDDEVGGIIVQLPLPPHYHRDAVLAAINPKKDIDAMTQESKNLVSPLPVEVVKDILKSVGEDMRKKHVAVVGRGFLVGKPIIGWLEDEGMPFQLFHSKSDLADLKYADIVITGAGKGGLITPNMLKEEVGVIDFGYDFIDGKIKGDFDPNDQFTGWYTPTPGGTGPILVAEIFKNFYKLNA
jgi:methylenetetrahydrofolate dehydrogenase (NADP+)/methenyltetrahydrofolate cyclohydrolase